MRFESVHGLKRGTFHVEQKQLYIIMKAIQILFAQLNEGHDVIDLFVHNVDCLIESFGLEALNNLPSEVAEAYIYFSNEMELV